MTSADSDINSSILSSGNPECLCVEDTHYAICNVVTINEHDEKVQELIYLISSFQWNKKKVLLIWNHLFLLLSTQYSFI